jgi:hypothetical protein
MAARFLIALVAAALAGSTTAHADASLTWDWILGGKLPANPPVVDYLDVDAFDTPKSFVTKTKQNGTTVICYISAGTIEDYRPDRKAFEKLNKQQKNAGKPAIIGKRYPAWPDERWLNFSRYKVFLPLMIDRIERCKSKGFDMIEFDNLDGHDNKTGFHIRKKHSIRYARALATEATKLGLASVQKNVTELNRKLEPYFAALLLEDCVLYNFCGDARRYRKSGKPVFDAEYPQGWADEGKTFNLGTACATTNANDISLIVKKLSLNTWVQYCP